MTVRITLFQPIDSPVRDHEFTSFVDKMGADVVVTQVDVVHDVLALPQSYVDDADGIIIGGSPHSMTNDSISEVKNFLKEVLLEAHRRHVPVLGVCFGHQLVAATFGGRVEQDEARHQKGFARVHATPTGQGDLLLHEIPSSFLVRLNHKDHVVTLPEDATLLLYNRVSEVQGFRLKDRPIYGVQFHPEINMEDVRHRYTHYGDHYFLNDEEQQQGLADLIPADDRCAYILRNFVAIVRDCIPAKT